MLRQNRQAWLEKVIASANLASEESVAKAAEVAAATKEADALEWIRGSSFFCHVVKLCLGLFAPWLVVHYLTPAGNYYGCGWRTRPQMRIFFAAAHSTIPQLKQCSLGCEPLSRAR